MRMNLAALGWVGVSLDVFFKFIISCCVVVDVFIVIVIIIICLFIFILFFHFI